MLCIVIIESRLIAPSAVESDRAPIMNLGPIFPTAMWFFHYFFCFLFLVLNVKYTWWGWFGYLNQILEWIGTMMQLMHPKLHKPSKRRNIIYLRSIIWPLKFAESLLRNSGSIQNTIPSSKFPQNATCLVFFATCLVDKAYWFLYINHQREILKNENQITIPCSHGL